MITYVFQQLIQFLIDLLLVWLNHNRLRNFFDAFNWFDEILLPFY